MKKPLLLAFVICAFISCAQEEVLIEKRNLSGVEYFSLQQGQYQGCMTLDGNVVIPLKRKYTSAYPSKMQPEHPLYYQVGKDGYSGICDEAGSEVISPDREYKAAFYVQQEEFPPFFFVENEDGLCGACDIDGKEIVPTKYKIIFHSLTGFTVLETEDGEYKNLGITLNSEGRVDSNAIIREKETEDDGFVWYKVYQNGVFGAESSKKKTIIPLSRGYTDIYYVERGQGKKGYFECSKGEKEGVCTIYGTEIIEPKYASVLFGEINGFEVKREEEDGKFVETGIMLASNGSVTSKAAQKKSTSQKVKAQSYSKSHHSAVEEKKGKKKGKWRKWLSNVGKVVGAVASVATGVPVNTSTYNENSPVPAGAERVKNPMGGYTDRIPQKDGTTLMINHAQCYMCKGTGRCSICGGRGGIVHPYLGKQVNCTGCATSGVCKYCRGTGEQVTRSVVDNQGNGYSVDMNGNVVTTGGGGGYSSSSSSSSKSSSSSNVKNYIETIEYAPNYTGKDNSEWCDVCKKVSPAHKHIKKFH